MLNNRAFYQTGITLVTLILIFLSIGIALVIIVPSFMGLDKDMRLTAMSHLEGSLRSSNLVIYAKAAQQGVDHLKNYHLDLDNDDNPDLYIRYGYARSLADLLYAMPKKELKEFVWQSGNSNDAMDNTMSHLRADNAEYCQIRYQRPVLAGDMPIYTAELNNC